MLSLDERRAIHDRICSSDHDYFVWSLLLGEPFLIDDVLCYYDGSCVAVSGPPLESTGTSWDIAERLERAVEHWMALPEVEFVNYFGPALLFPASHPAFDVVYSDHPRDFNLDLFVPLAQYPRADLERTLGRDCRRALRAGIVVEERHQDYLTTEQLRLVSVLTQRPEVEISDAAYIASGTAIVSHPATTVFEARAGGAVIGLGIAHAYFGRCPFFVTGAFRPGAVGAADAVYSAMISHYRERGAEYLGLGYAATAGQHRYKRKWGAEAHVGPAWQFIWRRHGSETPFRECLYWPWRVLVDKWCSTASVVTQGRLSVCASPFGTTR